LSSESNASRPRWPYHAVASRSTKSTACAACTHAESCAWVVPTTVHEHRSILFGLGFGSITGCRTACQNSNRHKNDMIEAFRHKLMGNEEELTRLRRSPSLSPHGPPRCG
jgi:hypothetical protein